MATEVIHSKSGTWQSIRLSVATIALREVGESDPLKYARLVLPTAWSDFQVQQYADTKEWCGLFNLWCLKEAGLAQDIFWRDGLGFLLVSPHALSRVIVPDTGDTAYFRRNQHHAVVCHVTDGVATLINGNGQGGKVTRTEVPIDHIDAFFSIESLLPKSEEV
jgi:hypothetical protein